jgi:hypothetical protein
MTTECEYAAWEELRMLALEEEESTVCIIDATGEPILWEVQDAA